MLDNYLFRIRKNSRILTYEDTILIEFITEPFYSLVSVREGKFTSYSFPPTTNPLPTNDKD